MVRIYYAAASLPPPHEKWAERILSRLDRNLPPEEAWSRATAESDAHQAQPETRAFIGPLSEMQVRLIQAGAALERDTNIFMRAQDVAQLAERRAGKDAVAAALDAVALDW